MSDYGKTSGRKQRDEQELADSEANWQIDRDTDNPILVKMSDTKDLSPRRHSPAL